jgi:DNA-binding beta-propeller fold protein YncE
MPIHPPSLGALLLAVLCAGTLALSAVAPAHAERPLISKKALKTEKVPGGSIEGACGVAVSSGTIYVSDYYHHAIDAFSIGGEYKGQTPGDPLDGPCGLASGPGGALYANDWHQSVGRVLPSSLGFDPEGESTGVAVDQASGDVYVDDRTHVAVYEPSGAAVLGEDGEPLRIGLGTLGEGYGVAVAPGKVYVPDAADDTIKIYEPATDAVNPVGVIDAAAVPGGRFNSLVDAAIAVDPSNGHVLVIDNLQPGFEHPEAAIDEFDPAGEFLGRLAQRVVDGEPSGIVVNNSTLYVTSGNDEEANLLTFGPYTPTPSPLMSQPSRVDAMQQVPAAAADSAIAAPSGPPRAGSALRLSSTLSSARDSSVAISAVLPAAGTISVAGRNLRPLRELPVEAGRRTLHLRLSAAGNRALARAKLHRLVVRALVTFIPSDGVTLFADKTVTFRSQDGGEQ